MIQHAGLFVKVSPLRLTGCPTFSGHDTVKMIPPILPPEIKATLDAKLESAARNAIAARADKISKTYRDGGGSAAIATEIDALAYALVRMPATYAALAASLNALSEVRPGYAPATLLDVGAGPGTASFAAAEAFASLNSFDLFDANGALRALALDLARGPRFDKLAYQRGAAATLLA